MLLTVKDLAIGYGKNIINDNLNFIINESDYLCIVGENGAGKSTLIKTLLQLIPPLKGEIIMGTELKKNEIGYLPQQTSIQKDFPASVWEIVLSGFQGRCGLRPFYNRKEKELAMYNIERMNITDLKDRCYRELSGGQQQRVLLARALCSTQKILLLDEPVTGLDPIATSELYEQILALNNEGVTIIMISHDITRVIHDSSHILHIGSKNFFGSKESYLNSELGKAFTNKQEVTTYDI